MNAIYVASIFGAMIVMVFIVYIWKKCHPKVETRVIATEVLTRAEKR